MARRDDTYFDYDNFLEIYFDDSDYTGTDSDSNKQTNCFASSVFYTEMRTNLLLEIFLKLLSIKFCHCVIDVAVYCKTKDIVYREFF